MLIDLRSDTVTKPTAAMRTAMAAAEVGDDVYGEDPTVNQLEERAAEIFEREAAVFVPSGTMGNLIAIRLHTEHGQEVVCEARSHIVDWEMAMISAFCGCMPRILTGECGILTWPQIRASIFSKPGYRAQVNYRARTGLIALENTHNMAGGTITPLETLKEIWEGAKDVGLPVHLDGARIFNAAIALDVGVAELTRGFDTVMFCLSKGLGAPVGSMLVGSRAAMERARIFRKALGGGLRQAGILAAAGLIALDEMPAVLKEDHANARMLAEVVAGLPAAEIDLTSVQTNIVIFSLRDGRSAAEIVQQMQARGVLMSAIGPSTMRMVTHYDVDRNACSQASVILADVLETG